MPKRALSKRLKAKRRPIAPAPSTIEGPSDLTVFSPPPASLNDDVKVPGSPPPPAPPEELLDTHAESDAEDPAQPQDIEPDNSDEDEEIEPEASRVEPRQIPLLVPMSQVSICPLEQG